MWNTIVCGWFCVGGILAHRSGWSIFSGQRLWFVFPSIYVIGELKVADWLIARCTSFFFLSFWKRLSSIKIGTLLSAAAPNIITNVNRGIFIIQYNPYIIVYCLSNIFSELFILFFIELYFCFVVAELYSLGFRACVVFSPCLISITENGQNCHSRTKSVHTLKEDSAIFQANVNIFKPKILT